jgi:hypothetical protein
MSDQNTTAGDPTNPQPPCGICKSTEHTTGFHGTGKAMGDKQSTED